MPKISQFPPGGAAQNTDLIPVVRNGGDYTVTGYNLAALASYGQAYVGTFTATAGQTVFTLPSSPGSSANLTISVDGSTMVPGTDYNWTTPTTLTFTTGLTNGQTVLYRYTTSVPIGTSLAGGTNNQIQYNNSGVLNGFTPSGDVAITPTTGVTKVNSVQANAIVDASLSSSSQIYAVNQTYNRTAAEIAASVTPTNYGYPPGDVRRYGADPTGVSDSATAINNAVASMNAGGGGIVTLPAGTFLIGSTINMLDYTGLKGAGKTATTIKLKNSANVNLIAKGGSATGIGISVTDLTFDGNQSNNTSGGVLLAGATGVRGPSWTIERVNITHCQNCVYAAGLHSPFIITGNTWSQFKDIDVINNDYAEMAMWIACADSEFLNLYIGTNGRSATSTGNNCGLYLSAAGNRFTDCYFGGTQQGPEVYLATASCKANNFEGCIVDNAGTYAVRLGVNVTQNRFIGGQIGNSSYSDGGTYYTILSDTTNGYNLFSGVSIYSNYATAYATNAYKESGGTTGGNLLVGCFFSGTWTSGVDGRTATSTTYIVGCQGFDSTDVGTLTAHTKLNVLAANSSAAPSVSATPASRINGGGTISLWTVNYGYNYMWLQSIQDDGSNNLKDLFLQPLGGNTRINGTSGNTLRVENGTANGSVATTLGSVGPTGSTAGNPQGWLRISVAGTDRYIPYW